MNASTILDPDTTLPPGAGYAARTTKAALLDDWKRMTKVVSEILGGDVQKEGWRARFLEGVESVRALAEREADLALYSLLFASGHDERSYGVTHSMICAVIVDLAGRWLDWSQPQLTSAVCAALSMNVGMANRQDKLAQQADSLTPEQRDQIERHPTASVDMLREAGVDDEDWIHAVLHHHCGQPEGDCDAAHPADKIAELIHRIDVYTAKLSRRASRSATSPAIAARDALLGPQGHPDHVGTTLLRVLGLYPPGTWVSLVNGELAIVIRRGTKAHTPVVASVRTRDGGYLKQPTRRETGRRECRIIHGIRAGEVRVELDHARVLSV